MIENLVSSIYLTGTSTVLENGNRVYDINLNIPFLDFFTVATIFLAAFFVFKLTFIDIWRD